MNAYRRWIRDKIFVLFSSFREARKSWESINEDMNYDTNLYLKDDPFQEDSVWYKYSNNNASTRMIIIHVNKIWFVALVG
jgi:hypothetical protein